MLLNFVFVGVFFILILDLVGDCFLVVGEDVFCLLVFMRCFFKICVFFLFGIFLRLEKDELFVLLLFLGVEVLVVLLWRVEVLELLWEIDGCDKEFEFWWDRFWGWGGDLRVVVNVEFEVCVWGIVLFLIKLLFEFFEIIFFFDIFCFFDLEFFNFIIEDVGLNDFLNDFVGLVEDMEVWEGMFGIGGVLLELMFGELWEMEIEWGLMVLLLLLLLGLVLFVDGVDEFFGGCLGGMFDV